MHSDIPLSVTCQRNVLDYTHKIFDIFPGFCKLRPANITNPIMSHCRMISSIIVMMVAGRADLFLMQSKQRYRPSDGETYDFCRLAPISACDRPSCIILSTALLCLADGVVKRNASTTAFTSLGSRSYNSRRRRFRNANAPSALSSSECSARWTA